MMRQIVVLGVLLGVTFQGFAQIGVDFHRRFQLLESERRFAAQEYADAQELFQALAGDAPNEAEKAALLARAAIALAHQEGQFEQALSKAAELDFPPASHYARMTLMTLRSDWEGIIETFGEIPITEWPQVRLPARPRGAEEELRTFALLKRSQAFSQTGDFVRAEQDLSAAADLVVSRHMRARPSLLSVLADLAALRAQRLDDAAGAFEANRRIAELGSGGARYFRGVLSAAAYLRDQERYDDAVAMLESMNPRGLQGSWFENSMQALGQALVRAGKMDEAIAVFQEVAERRTTGEGARGSAFLAWAGTLADAGQTAAALEVYRKLLAHDDLREAHREQAEAAIRKLEGGE